MVRSKEAKLAVNYSISGGLNFCEVHVITREVRRRYAAHVQAPNAPDSLIRSVHRIKSKRAATICLVGKNHLFPLTYYARNAVVTINLNQDLATTVSYLHLTLHSQLLTKSMLLYSINLQ